MIPSINKHDLHSRLLNEITLRLAEASYRATSPRRLVLREIAAQGTSFSASELLRSVTEAAPDVGRATVFRTLDLLVELGVLQRVHTATKGSWGHLYVLCGLTNTHHHHLVCKACGQITDLEGCFLDDAMLNELQARTDFRVEEHHLELYGRCGRCQED